MDNDMYREALNDLKQEYPKRKILFLNEVADYVSRSSGALYKLKDRNRLSIPFSKEGGKYQISIYALAKWVAEAEDLSTAKPKEVTVEPIKPRPPIIKDIKRNRPSLAKIICQFGSP